MATTTALITRSTSEPSQLEKVSVGSLKENEVLVEIAASGICHTDLSCMSGTIPMGMPCVLGHEGAGTVLDFGRDVKNVTRGDKVLLSFANCGACKMCSDKHPAYCLSFFAQNFSGARGDGTNAFTIPSSNASVHGNFFGQSSFARRAVVNSSTLVKVPSDTPLDLFAPLGCGMQTGAGCILNVLNVQKGKSVVVCGAGGVGLSAIMTAAIRGAHPIVAIDLQESRLALAKKVGATHTINGSVTDLADQIRSVCPPNGANYAVECTGVPKVLETMLDALGSRGRGAVIGASGPGAKVNVDIFSHLLLGKEFVGCCEGDAVPGELIPWLIEQQRAGRYPLEALITYYDVKEHAQAVKDMREGRTVKPVLRWDSVD